MEASKIRWEIEFAARVASLEADDRDEATTDTNFDGF